LFFFSFLCFFFFFFFFLLPAAATNTKANYKSALTNPLFLKVFRSISGISNGKP
jgi:hypothetical protein